MIGCKQAEQLFDGHLDGTLSPSWTAELHAHQVECAACRRSLALLRACGDVVATDCAEPRMSGDFTDRLMGALAGQSRPVIPWPRRVLRAAGSLGVTAAAAMVALMIMVPREVPESPTAVAGMQVQAEDLDAAFADFMSQTQGAIYHTQNLKRIGIVLWREMLDGADEAVRDMLVPLEETPLSAPAVAVEPDTPNADVSTK